jgi:hypothetical protein
LGSYNEDLKEVVEEFMIRNCVNDVSSSTFQFWLFAARYSSIESIKDLMTKVEEDQEFAQNFNRCLFEFTNEVGSTILMYAKENKSQEVLELFKTKMS